MRKKGLFLTIIVWLSAMHYVQAQNLLDGWNNTGGTPYDAGWRVDQSVSVTWGTLNGSDNRFRTGVGSPASNGTDPMLYITAQDTKFGYPVTPTGGKLYRFTGNAWRRNGASGSVNFNFYLANNLLASNPVSTASTVVSGNNVVSPFDVRLVAPEGFTSGYLLWDVHVNSGNWDHAGIWLLDMTELGNARSVTFNTGGGSTVDSQYFLEGESFQVNKPADPTRPGYIFKGWYSDAGFTDEYDFSSQVTTDTIIYAKWENLYMTGWAGNGAGATADKPDDFGWACSSSVTWMDASDSNDNYAYRYRDNLGVGRVITHPVNNNVFSFPVYLDAGKAYQFGCSNSNMNNGTVSTTFGINSSSDATGTMLKSQTKTSSRWEATTTFDFIFTVKESGMYYLTWQTTNGSDRNFAWDFLITETGNALSVTFDTDGGSVIAGQYFVNGETIAEPAEPVKAGFIFAGWFTDNTYAKPFNFNVPVSTDITVYARFEPEGNPTVVDVLIENDNISFETAMYMNITVKGKSELHILSSSPLINSTVNLTSDDSWLYFDSIKPSTVTSNWLIYIKIKGQALNPQTDRIAIYGGGTVVIPDGKLTAKEALIAYNQPNFGGESKTFEADKYYRDTELGSFDNNIRSFKLKKGYSCTFANNPNGTGHSRVFIASDEDIEVPVMPEGLEFASFVRVFRWEWISKKGICNGSLAGLTNASWFNDWAAGGNTENPDYEYVPMRHNLGWDSFDVINARTNVSHVLGYNEPDHTDQANCTPEEAILQWPELFKSGLRLGSPTPDAIRKQWLVDFLALADELNYRVDFVVGHMYWDSRSGQGLYNDIVDACTRLYGGRPMWITEWNNGANWTSESWPTASGSKRDADMNIIYPETTVTRPLSPENAAKQLAWIKDVLDGFDRCEYLERHSLYNWVQDARAVVLGDKLTPAGKYFADFKSKVAFSKNREYIHQWKIAPSLLSSTLADDYKTITLNWYDHNGETGKCYVLGRKFENEADFSVVDTLHANVDYTYGETVTYVDNITMYSAEYRIKAISYKDTESAYSRILSLTLDPAIAAPSNLSGDAVSSTIIDLSWDAVSDARSYNLKRSASHDGVYETIAAYFTGTSFRDESLSINTTYFYKISSLNNRGETADATPVEITTKTIVIPNTITGILISEGDTQVALSWDHQYDAKFRIYRSDSADGSYTVVADNIEIEAFKDVRYVDASLVNGKSRFYKIAAFNDEGEYVDPAVYEAAPKESQHAYFKFDAAEGKVVDSWGGYHGALFDGTAYAEGKYGNALSFADNSYAKLGEGIVSELSDFTIAMWTNFSAAGARIFDFGNSTGTFMVLMPAALRYKITCPTGTFDVTPVDFEGNATYGVGGSRLNEWHHVTLTQAGTTFKIYLDGNEILSRNDANVSPKDMGVTVNNYLVKSEYGSDAYSTGKIDEFRIYNRALGAEEIVALMNESVHSVELDVNTETLQMGETLQLTATIFPDNASNKNVSWSSSDEAVATVTAGLVTAVSAGSAVITVTTADGSKTATCTVTVNTPAVPVQSVSIDITEKELSIGEALQLTATIFPDNASDKNVGWSSSNNAVATVTAGLVTAVSAGSAVITVTTADGGKTATCTVTVNTPAVPVQSVSIDITQMSLYPGETQQLTATVDPDNASDKNVGWSSSNNAVATVTAGLVTAVSAGSAEITVTTADGGKTATCTVRVYTIPAVRVQSVSLDITEKELSIGERLQLTATVRPNSASNKKVRWSSGNNAIATVTAGLVTAVSAGNTVITVTTDDGGKTATCEIRAVTGTGTEAMEDFKLSLYFKGNILYVESPASERIDVYSLTGQLLVQQEKQAGLARIAVTGSSGQILIVKGNSGWVMKVIKQQ